MKLNRNVELPKCQFHDTLWLLQPDNNIHCAFMTKIFHHCPVILHRRRSNCQQWLDLFWMSFCFEVSAPEPETILFFQQTTCITTPDLFSPTPSHEHTTRQSTSSITPAPFYSSDENLANFTTRFKYVQVGFKQDISEASFILNSCTNGTDFTPC